MNILHILEVSIDSLGRFVWSLSSYGLVNSLVVLHTISMILFIFPLLVHALRYCLSLNEEQPILLH